MELTGPHFCATMYTAYIYESVKMKKARNNDFSLSDIKNTYCDSKILKSGQKFTFFIQRV